MPETLIKVDLAESPYANPQIHNRWHPDIPMATWVRPGDEFILETYDWTGGYIRNNRTVPPREHGGNCDIKDLSRGSKIYFPVYADGAGLSVGDLHFSQGDGEITFCGAIEMAGWVHMKVELIKGGMAKYGIRNPIFKPSPITPNYNDYPIFEGISVDEHGKQHYLDVHVAYKQACLNAINCLTKFGYTPAQAYSILGTAPVQGHISDVVDIPNACATLWLPTQIFDFDIRPNANGPTKFLDGSVDMPTSPDRV